MKNTVQVPVLSQITGKKVICRAVVRLNEEIGRSFLELTKRQIYHAALKICPPNCNSITIETLDGWSDFEITEDGGYSAIDSANTVKRGRGRPPSGDKTMTNAERQALSRKRLAAAGRGTITLVLSDELLAALDKFVEFKDMSKSDAISKILTTQLFRKR